MDNLVQNMEQKNQIKVVNSFYRYKLHSKINTQIHFLSKGGFNHRPQLFQKFVQALMKTGHKGKAESILWQTFKNLEQKKVKSENVFNILENAVKNTQPFFSLKKSRIAGTVQLIPFALESTKKEKIAIRWLVKGAIEKQRKNLQKGRAYSFPYFFATELYDASNSRGTAVLIRDSVHKLAEANRVLMLRKWW